MQIAYANCQERGMLLVYIKAKSQGYFKCVMVGYLQLSWCTTLVCPNCFVRSILFV